MAQKKYENPLEEVIGTVEDVQFLKDGQTKDGKVWEKYKVIINGEEYQTFEPRFQDEVGKEGSYKFSRESWTDKSGGQHTSKQLIRFQGVRRFTAPNVVPATMPELKVGDESKAIFSALHRIESALSRIERDIHSAAEDTGLPQGL